MINRAIIMPHLFGVTSKLIKVRVCVYFVCRLFVFVCWIVVVHLLTMCCGRYVIAAHLLAEMFTPANGLFECDEEVLVCISLCSSEYLKYAVFFINLTTYPTSPQTYTASAKKLIMEVLAEAHCANELREAMLLGSVPLLKDAIKRAEESKMVYLAELRDAKRALSAALHLRSIVTSIET